MRKETKQFVSFLRMNNIIGKKHTPEKRFIKVLTRCLNKQEKKEFEKEYKLLITTKIIQRTKKRTGKGTDYHISLNPRKIKEIMEIIK